MGILDKPTGSQARDEAAKPLQLTEVPYEDLRALKAEQEVLKAQVCAVQQASENNLREMKEQHWKEKLDRKQEQLEEKLKHGEEVDRYRELLLIASRPQHEEVRHNPWISHMQRGPDLGDSKALETIRANRGGGREPRHLAAPRTAP